MLLLGEHMLYPRAHRRLRRIGPQRPLRHRLAVWFFAVDAADKAETRQIGLVLLRAIGGVGPDIGGGVAPVEQALAQPCSLISRSIGDLPPPDQAEAAVDGDVVLVAEARNGDIHRRLAAVGARLGLGELHPSNAPDGPSGGVWPAASAIPPEPRFA